MMDGVTYQQMQVLEEGLFSAGIDPADLMEEASRKVARFLQQLQPEPASLLVYLGKGNNAGDGLVVAHLLQQAGWRILVRRAYPIEAFKPLPAKHWAAFHPDFDDVSASGVAGLSTTHGALWILDAVLGIGLTQAPRGPAAEAIQEINALRHGCHAKVVALDLPSGLLEDAPSPLVVQADFTVTLGVPKKALLREDATAWVGRLAWINFEALETRLSRAWSPLLTSRGLRALLPHRPFEFHKGQAGRVGLVAGSARYTGAAVLCALGALKGGAGLITLYVKPDFYEVLVAKLPPEIMVKCVKQYREILEDRLDVLAIGPGLSAESDSEILELLQKTPLPVVIDAEGLNVLSREGLETLRERQSPTLLTPHPGEMSRLLLAAEKQPQSRLETVQQWCGEFPQVTLLFKGARTLIGSSAGPIAYNTTGSPGMACGGMGDVLTGLSAALLGQGVGMFEAACLAAWLSGRAAELAIAQGHASEESLTATDVALHLGDAFRSLKRLDD